MKMTEKDRMRAVELRAIKEAQKKGLKGQALRSHIYRAKKQAGWVPDRERMNGKVVTR